MNLSPEEKAAVERMSRSLVDKLLRGPISEVMTCAESGTSPQDQRGPEEPGDRRANESPGEVDDSQKRARCRFVLRIRRTPGSPAVSRLCPRAVPDRYRAPSRRRTAPERASRRQGPLDPQAPQLTVGSQVGAERERVMP